MAELEKCPFCGGNAEWGTVLKTWIVCRNCGFETPYSRDTEETIKLWNNRTAEQEIRNKAIGEFAERLKVNAVKTLGGQCIMISPSMLDEIANEMKGGTA